MRNCLLPWQKFKFCGDLDAPDWILKEIAIISKLVRPFACNICVWECLQGGISSAVVGEGPLDMLSGTCALFRAKLLSRCVAGQPYSLVRNRRTNALLFYNCTHLEDAV
jgi:hypothetical protein